MSDLNDLLAMRGGGVGGGAAASESGSSFFGVVGAGGVFASGAGRLAGWSTLSLLGGNLPAPSPYEPAWWRNHPTPGSPQYEKWKKQTQLTLRALFGLPSEEKVDQVVPGPEIFRKHLHAQLFQTINFQNSQVNMSVTLFDTVFYTQTDFPKVRLGRFHQWLKNDQGKYYAMQYLWGDLCKGFGQRNITINFICDNDPQIKKELMAKEVTASRSSLKILPNSFIESLQRPCNYNMTIAHPDVCYF
jgi:hypothetical protein